MTNFMVVKNLPNLIVQEANPVSGRMLNAVIADDGPALITGIIIHTLLLSVLVGTYIYHRLKSDEDGYFYPLLVYTLFIFLTCALDFTNDLGFVLGKLIFHI